MSKQSYVTEALVARLSPSGCCALIQSVFDGRVWTLQSTPAEVMHELSEFKLISSKDGINMVTRAGLAARAIVVRQSHRQQARSG